MPKDRKEMLGIAGVGTVKYDKYGDRFTAVILDYLNSRKSVGSDARIDRSESDKSTYEIVSNIQNKDVDVEKLDNRNIIDRFDERLFEKLRELRLKLAKLEKLPAYCILSNRTLEELATIKPQTKEQMLAIHGIGLVKYDKYGEEFLKVLID